MDEVEGVPKKWFCLKCGHVFESDRESPHCPACHRRKVAPLDLLKSALEKYKDILQDNGLPVQDVVNSGFVRSEPIQESELKVDDNLSNDSLSKDSVSTEPKSDKLILELLEDAEESEEDKPKKVKRKVKQKVKQVKEKVEGISVPKPSSGFLGIIILLGVIYFLWKKGIIQKFLFSETNQQVSTYDESSILKRVHRNLSV